MYMLPDCVYGIFCARDTFRFWLTHSLFSFVLSRSIDHVCVCVCNKLIANIPVTCRSEIFNKALARREWT